ncbi:DUF6777 domain-containing protein [Streptomyces sp. NPDC001820]|uniref:DUF6777 domain-containing protein n=1 Tax=Streptomyces sp. NPDC001820 TaxID=3364613 RepID=UPI00369F5786
MSAQPPPERPTGPPSGPLSGPSQDRPTRPTPPPGPPTGPPSGGGSGGGGSDGPGGGGPAQDSGEGPQRPWWRSVPRIATIAIAVVAAVVLAIVFTRPGGQGAVAAEEIVRDPVNSSGEAPFTPPSTVEEAPTGEAPAPPTTNLRGSDAGVYGGTQRVASCDVEKQISYLSADPAKNSAFASALGLSPSQVPGYLRSLTPLRLSYDTRVTNHRYKDGAPSAYQSVLQAGTAVLVDDHGVPRVRCACGNPLKPPVKVEGNVRLTGPTWPGFQPTKVVQVQPSATVIDVFVVYDPHRDDWFERKQGDQQGRHDNKVPPPPRPKPPHSPSPHTTSPSGEPPTKSPPSTKSPAPKSPSPKSPAPKSPSPEPPTSKPPEPEPPPQSDNSAPAPPPADTPASETMASSASSLPVDSDAARDSSSSSPASVEY